MRKLLSIVIALGLILTLSVMAAPAAADIGAADPTGCANVTATDQCEFEVNNWTIDFISEVTLLNGNDLLSVHFGAGTDLTGVAVTIGLDGAAHATPTVVNADGADLSFVVPADIVPGDVVAINVTGTVNPGAGPYVLVLDFQWACCEEEPFCEVAYTIKPAEASYDMALNFSPTYPGIKYDWVPPFQACGQAVDEEYNEEAEENGYYTELWDGDWFDVFTLDILVDTPGCDVPCDPALLIFCASGFPSATAVINISINGTHFGLTAAAPCANTTVVLDPEVDINLDGLLHFNEIGEYEICFTLICEWDGEISCDTVPQCTEGIDTVLVEEKCYDFVVHQWKDAYKILLFEKWNLISLPLVPFTTNITLILDSMPDAQLDELVSVWYYDLTDCPDEGTWLCYTPNGDFDTLTTMEDGKSYWFRFNYPLLDDPYALWVFGTEKPEPYGPPAAYAVCEGWNMIGFTSLLDMPRFVYLWNWFGVFGQPDPVIYTWWNNGDWMTQSWALVGFGGWMWPTQGFWTAFPIAGTVYVP